YRLTLTMTDVSGETKSMSYEVTVRNVAPTFRDVGWSRDGDRVVVSGQLIDPGIYDSHLVSVTWSDGTVTQTTVENGPNGRLFKLERPDADQLRRVTITAADTKDPKNVASVRLNGARAGDPPTPPATPEPERRGDLRQDGRRFADAAAID